MATENTTESETARGVSGNGAGRGSGGACFLALGANLGDKLSTLRMAVTALDAHEKIDVDYDGGIASLYETAPVGCGADQPNYINTAIRIETTLSPHELLGLALETEERLGRARRALWESRLIDIDLLLYVERGAQRAVDTRRGLVCVAAAERVVVVETDELTLPHPRLSERRFVLDPLAEIAPDVIHPSSNGRIADLAERAAKDCADQVIARIAGPAWVRGDLKRREASGAAS